SVAKRLNVTDGSTNTVLFSISATSKGGRGAPRMVAQPDSVNSKRTATNQRQVCIGCSCQRVPINSKRDLSGTEDSWKEDAFSARHGCHGAIRVRTLLLRAGALKDDRPANGRNLQGRD